MKRQGRFPRHSPEQVCTESTERTLSRGAHLPSVLLSAEQFPRIARTQNVLLRRTYKAGAQGFKPAIGGRPTSRFSLLSNGMSDLPCGATSFPLFPLRRQVHSLIAMHRFVPCILLFVVSIRTVAVAQQNLLGNAPGVQGRRQRERDSVKKLRAPESLVALIAPWRAKPREFSPELLILQSMSLLTSYRASVPAP